MLRFNTLRYDPNGEGAAAPPSSEANPADPAGSEAGSAGEGAGTGSPAGGSPQAEGGQTTTPPAVDWQARARSHQSRADRAEAELQRVRQALAAEQPQQTGDGDGPLTMSQLSSFLDRRGAIDRVLASAPQQYQYAHPQIIQHAYQYESAEALIAALEDSHAQEAAYRERVRAEVMAEAGVAGAPAASQQGDPRPPATGGGSAEAGPPTVQQLAKMTQAQLDAVEKQYPGHLTAALADAEQDTIYTGT